MPAIIILLKTIFYMAIKIILILLALAIADWFFQKWRHEENLKMSKEEIKEEYKQREGDPRIKQKIREKQRQASTRRMMDEVPKATVVVTNPTHIACALRYDPEQNNAPIVVAMGAGLIARKIKEIANENNVPIVENKPLARALYKMVEIGDEIPSDLYGAVVEILAQVYRTRSKQA
jgi:flagellar biosynthetic protein FlhB